MSKEADDKYERDFWEVIWPTLSDKEKARFERIRNATPEEINQSLIDAGVYTPDGRLTKKYGGSA